MSSLNNIYREDIDFAVLALQDADFAKVLKPNGQLDFSSPESVQQLTKSLLKRDFGLKLSLPDDRLCPPVPNRLNYLLWIQSLLDTSSSSFTDLYDTSREVVGLDIGTGASCIYPLLGSSLRSTWSFAATDIDSKSLSYAAENVRGNSLERRIKLLKTEVEDPLLPLDKIGEEVIDFSMCNPPFYESKDEMIASASVKRRAPFTACTGSENEMVTHGGEVAFVQRMIEESGQLQDRVQWYTSMLGKFSSVPTVVGNLKEKGIDNFAVTEFVQGRRTRRWGVAWSYRDLRPSIEVARGVGSLPKSLMPFPGDYFITLDVDGDKASACVNELISKLPLKWVWKASLSMGLGFSEKAVWSRAARRRVAKPRDAEDNDEKGMAFGFKVCVKNNSGGPASSKTIIRWTKGHDSIIFESFCGMVKRALERETKA